MRRDSIPSHLSSIAFEFFYWFSRFEFALKENGYLKSHQAGANAEPGWDAFERRWRAEYTLSNAAESLLQLAPSRQVVSEHGELRWAVVETSRSPSDLAKIIRLLKVVRNNLFHGGKHGSEDWDNQERTELLLESGLSILMELAKLSGIEADYERYY
ncbi:hypothetical protein [Burkholderia sp. Ax-1724]|uniref:hypothetical protein n=1 Tax=Burkholderia sp. Ax-1724 TaxID=2608336 RepID=UPI00141E23FA|nr:hypothetical protein [Burkholderia sp. Ax-1724]NIF53318.1 hypothetical protein [Burkholderia sp. Ax-1724]